MPIFQAAVLTVWFAAACLAADERKPDPPVPAKLERVYTLPSFCIAEGLGPNRRILRVRKPAAPGAACSLEPPNGKGGTNKRLSGIVVPADNADTVSNELQPQLPQATSANTTVAATAATTGTATATATSTGTPPPAEFTLAPAAGNRSIIVFCREKTCRSDLRNLETAIDSLARPSYSYFLNYKIDSLEMGAKLAGAVPVINSQLSAEVIDARTLRVESTSALSEDGISELVKRLDRDRDFLRTTPTPPTPSPAQRDAEKDIEGLPPAQEVVAIDLPFFCQANDLQTPPYPFKGDGCKDKWRKVQANNTGAIVKAIEAALGKSSNLTLSIDGGRILVACEKKCSGEAFGLVRSTIAAIARPDPLFVRIQPFPKGTASIAAKVLNVAPLTAAALTDSVVQVASNTPVSDSEWERAIEHVREEGFGRHEPEPLQRMFYRSAADVVASLLTTPTAAPQPTLGANAATAPVTGNSGGAGATTSPAAAGSAAATLAATAPATPPAPANPPAASAPNPPPSGSLGQGMAAVDDSVVFTDTNSARAVRQRERLLTLLDLPRPEVLMNLWSLQASSPDGKEIANSLQKARDLVDANNEALQNAIDYGWAYLSREMKKPDFFDKGFYDYLTRRFVADTGECEATSGKTGCELTPRQIKFWDLCPPGQYCLGYARAFTPVRPSLTSIILAMLAAKHTAKVVLTTIGCMQGQFEVYGDDCFPGRNELAKKLPAPLQGNRQPTQASRTGGADNTPGPDLDVACLRKARAEFLSRHGAGDIDKNADYAVVPKNRAPAAAELSCQTLDRAAVYARRACGLTVALPLSCFTIQAAKSLLPDSSFSTLSPQQLNSLAEQNLETVASSLRSKQVSYRTTSVGLLRSAVADFLFNYKVAEQYPEEFGTYLLPHSAQELNSRLDPLVVAFNQDVAALSRTLLDQVQYDLPNQNHFFQLWRHNKSFIADGLITVRGIGGIESLVDTDSQSSFDATQAQTLNAVMSSILGGGSTSAATSSANSNTNTNTNNITINPDGSVTPAASGGGGGGISCGNGSLAGSSLCAVANLFKGGTTAPGIAALLAAVTPIETHAEIGRQLTLDVIPHTLPGASSAELDMRLWAQEDSPPTLYTETGSSSNDFQSRVARHNVATRVRVESVKLFDVSSFTAMVQRPRSRLPIVPPLIEIPLIGNILGVPLPAAKIYYASSAIVSALIVPTAADLAFGLEFSPDRAVFCENPKDWYAKFSLLPLTSHDQIPHSAPI